MGCAISWLAVAGKRPAEVHETLGLAATGARHASSHGPIDGAMLSTGWYLVCFEEYDHAQVSDAVLERLSAGCRVLMCQVEEHVMHSGATLYANGARSWRVEHCAEQDPRDLRCEGQLPDTFHEIALAAAVRQDQEDLEEGEWQADHYFEVALELAEQLTGYRYDIEPDTAGGLPFERLERNAPPLPLWKRLFQR